MKKSELINSQQLNDLIVRSDFDNRSNFDEQHLKTPNNICKKFMHLVCSRENCPYSHDLSKATFCKSFINSGHCPRAETCNFRHKSNAGDSNYNSAVCKVFQETGSCNDGDKCPYKHTKLICRNYAKGFCQLGPKCPNLHQQTLLCINYLYGFCPKGPDCSFTQLIK